MKIKKLVAIILCMIMLISLPMGAVASAACDCGVVPTIYVSGIATKEIMQNIGTEEESILFPTSSDAFKTSFNTDTILSLLGYAATADWDFMADAFVSYFNGAFAGLGCEVTGDPAEGTGIVWPYPTSSVHNAENEYDFYYDWRCDPLVIGEELSDYIEYVCALTGHDKVNIIAFSMGSVITMSYIYLHGDARINNICFTAPAFNGATCAGEPFNSQVNFAPVAVMRFVDAFIGNDGNGLMVKSMVEVLKKVGVLGGLTDYLNEMIENILPEVYEGVFMDTFLTMPGLWALIPDEYYESSKTQLTSEPEKYATLIARIDEYHYGVQTKLAETLKALKASGKHNIAIIAKYGSQVTPVVDSWENMSDGVLDTKYSSFGATCASLDGTLGENYVQAVNDGHNHISPDNQIDASTCLFPDYTWFVKDMLHMKSTAQLHALERYILYSDVQADVFSNDAYPQFLRYDEADNSISPLTGSDGNGVSDYKDGVDGESWFSVLYRFIKSLFAFVIDIFNK